MEVIIQHLWSETVSKNIYYRYVIGYQSLGIKFPETTLQMDFKMRKLLGFLKVGLVIRKILLTNMPPQSLKLLHKIKIIKETSLLYIYDLIKDL